MMTGVCLVFCSRSTEIKTQMTVDIMVNAMDNPAPGTVVIITGDRDFAYVVSVLRMRRYRVVVIAPHNHHISIRNQASIVLDWSTIISSTNVDVDDIPSHTPCIPPSVSASMPVGNSNPVSESYMLFQGRSKRAIEHLIAMPPLKANALSGNGQGGITSPPNISCLSTPVSFSRASDSTSAVASRQDLRTEVASYAPALRSAQQPSAQTSLPPLYIDKAIPSTIITAPTELEPVTTSTYVIPRTPGIKTCSF
jgi:NYN domain